MGKIQVKGYTFNALSRTVTFTDYVNIDLDSILLITNVTHGNTIIYNFAGEPTVEVPTGLGGTVSGNVLTLAYLTSSMSNTDKLQIWYWDTDAIETVNTGLIQGVTNAELRATPVPISGTVSTGLVQPLTDAQLRTTPVPISGTISTGLTQPLTDAQLRATPVPVSGSVTVDTTGLSTGSKQDTGNTSLDSIDNKLDGPIPVSGAIDTGLTQPLTNTELRATAVPISGTVTANTGLVQPLTDAQLRATAVPISGTITANAGTNLNTSALALEVGGNLATIAAKDFATSAKQDTGNTSLADIAYTLELIRSVDGIQKITDALPAGSAIIGKFGIDQTTPGTTNKVSIGTDGIVAISAGSAVIGHVIADIGSTTAVTGNVTIIQGTASNLHVAATLDAETTKVIGTINIAASQAVAVTNAGTFAVQSASTLAAETTKVIGTVNIAGSQTIAVTNTGTFAVQSASTLAAETTKVIGTVNIASGQTVALAAGSAAIGKLTANTGVIIGDVNVVNSNVSTNVAQINGITPLMGNGATGTGSPRVTIANDNTDIPTKSVPQTSGGLTTYHLVSAGTTNATVIKNGAGQVYGWYISNQTASLKKVAFHDTASTPTAGASIFFSLVIPANSATNVFVNVGIVFASGISITTVTTSPDSASTAVAVGDLVVNIFYK